MKKLILLTSLLVATSTPASAMPLDPLSQFLSNTFGVQKVDLHPHNTGWRRFLRRPLQGGAIPIYSLVTEAAHRHGVPAGIAHGVIHVESGYRCGARNGAHYGLGQVAPATARSVGVHGNLFDCRTGIEAAMRYLRLALARGGAGCAGVSLYNMGIYAKPRCTGYGAKVMRMSGR